MRPHREKCKESMPFELYFSSMEDWRTFEADGGATSLRSINGDVTGLSYKVLLPMAGIVTELNIDGDSLPPEISPLYRKRDKGARGTDFAGEL